MKTIYLVEAVVAFESSTVILAYTDKTRAEKFCARCNKHVAKYPVCPAVEDSDAKWAAHGDKITAWTAKHPAGPLGSSMADYVVTPVRLL